MIPPAQSLSHKPLLSSVLSCLPICCPMIAFYLHLCHPHFAVPLFLCSLLFSSVASVSFSHTPSTMSLSGLCLAPLTSPMSPQVQRRGVRRAAFRATFRSTLKCTMRYSSQTTRQIAHICRVCRVSDTAYSHILLFCTRTMLFTIS